MDFFNLKTLKQTFPNVPSWLLWLGIVIITFISEWRFKILKACKRKCYKYKTILECRKYIRQCIDQSMDSFFNDIMLFKDKSVMADQLKKKYFKTIKFFLPIFSGNANKENDYPVGIKALYAFVKINDAKIDDSYKSIKEIVKLFNKKSKRYSKAIIFIIQNGLNPALEICDSRGINKINEYCFIIEAIKNKFQYDNAVIQTLIACFEYVRTDRSRDMLYDFIRMSNQYVIDTAIERLGDWNEKKPMSDDSFDILAKFVCENAEQYREDQLCKFFNIYGNSRTAGGPNILNAIVNAGTEKLGPLYEMIDRSTELKRNISEATEKRQNVAIEDW